MGSEEEEKSLKHYKMVKKHFLKLSRDAMTRHGCPSTAEDWAGWRQLLLVAGADEQMVKDVYQDIVKWIHRRGKWVSA